MHTSVTKLSPCALVHHPLREIRKKYCGTCNRWFLSEKYFQNHMTLKVKGKLVCQWRQVCRNCSFIVKEVSKHECFKKLCNDCYKSQHSGHFSYVDPLKPSKLTYRFLYVLFHMVCTQDLEKHDRTFQHFPNSYVLSSCVLNVKRWML